VSQQWTCRFESSRLWWHVTFLSRRQHLRLTYCLQLQGTNVVGYTGRLQLRYMEGGQDIEPGLDQCECCTGSVTIQNKPSSIFWTFLASYICNLPPLYPTYYDPQKRGRMFIQNVGNHWKYYIAQQPRWKQSQNACLHCFTYKLRIYIKYLRGPVGVWCWKKRFLHNSVTCKQAH
jgi:hypothetical protein